MIRVRFSRSKSRKVQRIFVNQSVHQNKNVYPGARSCVNHFSASISVSFASRMFVSLLIFSEFGFVRVSEGYPNIGQMVTKVFSCLAGGLIIRICQKMTGSPGG